MLFNSLQFLVFFVVVYILYLFLKHKWQNRLLVLASCLFYASWNWQFLFLMLVSITTDYICAFQIDRSEDKSFRKKMLMLSIGVNLAILFFFKYFNFFAGNVEFLLKSLHVLPAQSHWVLNIILPLGISFYTFEAISYVVDVYNKKTKPATRYEDYVLFVIYFPHLIAGPIMRAKSFLPQIVTPRVLTLPLFYEGCHLFFWGLFEKLFIADNMAKIVNPIFANPGPYEGTQVLIGLYAFAFQIFCDFDGYSNMARGLGKCMGFDISINFNLPYFSTNPREFWQRWHISLSTWLRDYLYIPLGGNRNGQAQMYANLLITMLLGGLWHGASWTFVLWGFYHGVLLVIYHARTSAENVSAARPFWLTLLKMIVFFHIVVIGWLFFRAQSLEQIGGMLHAIVFNFKPSHQTWLLFLNFIFLCIPLWLVQIGQYKTQDLLFLFKQKWFIKRIIYAFMTYLLIVFGASQAQEFIYFQF